MAAGKYLLQKKTILIFETSKKTAKGKLLVTNLLNKGSVMLISNLRDMVNNDNSEIDTKTMN